MLAEARFIRNRNKAGQTFDCAGLESAMSEFASDIAGLHTRLGAAGTGSAHPANFADHPESSDDQSGLATCAERAIQEAGAALLSALPLQDAIRLSLLAATAGISWPKIHAALNGEIKRACAETIRRLIPPCLRAAESLDIHRARQRAEREIWARFHARCDAVFAAAPAPDGNGAQAHERLLSTDRLLDIHRIARDTELADLDRRPGLSCSAPIPDGYETVSAALEPSGEETAAMGELAAAGFAGSVELREVVETFAVEVADILLERLAGMQPRGWISEKLAALSRA